MAIDAYARVLAKKAAGMTAPIIQDAVNQAAADGKITTGATAEQAAQIAQNTQDISELMRGGIAGENGGYYAPSVDADGNLTWIASQDGMTAVDGANIKGVPGDAGITPTIGENGNWYLGDTDTGKPSQGADGDDGKSAYRYAQDGGYTGPEDEFAAKMAQGNESNAWTILDDITTEEDGVISITRSGIHCTKLDAVIVCETAPESAGTIYFTNKGDGTIYGEPRINIILQNRVGITEMYKYIRSPMFVEAICHSQPWLAGNYAAPEKTIWHKNTAVGVVNQDCFTAYTLKSSNSVPAGTRIVIRGC